MDYMKRINISGLLTGSFLVFLLIITQKPFYFSLEPVAIKSQAAKLLETIFDYFTILKHTRSDTIANIILFIPAGFFLTWFSFENKHIGTRSKRIMYGLSRTIMISTSIELIQLFNTRRFPSAVDLTTNTAGGMIGLLMFEYILAWYKNHITQIQEYFRTRWDFQLLLAAPIVFMIYNWFPFHIVVSKWNVYRHIGVFTEFSFSPSEFVNAIPQIILLFFFMFFLVEFLLKEYSLPFPGNTIIMNGITLLTVSFTYGLQLTVYYRFTSFSEFLAIFFAIIFFNIYFFPFLKNQYPPLKTDRQSLARLLRIFGIVYLTFLISATAFPIGLKNEFSRQFINFFIPFHDYNSHDSVKFVLDFFKDMLKFTPVIILISASLHLSGKIWKNSYYFFAVLMLFFLECLQFFNKLYTPDLFDVIIGSIGIFLGRLLWLSGLQLIKKQEDE